MNVDNRSSLPSFGQPQYNATAFPQEERSDKEWKTVLLLCVFLGFAGGHRFYTGYKTIGIIQLLSFGGLCVWWLSDLLKILVGAYTDSDGRLITN